MITPEQFFELIQRPEGKTLDFKQCGYSLSEKKGKSDFIKDILAFSNTPRESTAHIVLGVKWTPEKGSEVIGLATQFDDSRFADIMSGNGVLPLPELTYTPLRVNVDDLEKLVGVIEIHIAQVGPITCSKDIFECENTIGIRRGTIYYRNMSSNTIAIESKIGEIARWFSSQPKSNANNEVPDKWDSCLQKLSHFDRNRNYVLVIDTLKCIDSPCVMGLGLVPWIAVFDFDSQGESQGVLSKIGGEIRQHRNLQTVFKGNRFPISPHSGTHWFFANGQDDKPNSVASGGHNSWIKLYKREIAEQLELLQKALSPTPTSFIFLDNSPHFGRHMRTLSEEIFGTFGETAELILIREEEDEMSDLLREQGGQLVNLSSRGFCIGLCSCFKKTQTGSNNYHVPTNEKVPVQIAEKDRIWMQQDLEIVFLGMKESEDASPDSFYRGSEVTWRNLQLRHDCDRELTKKISRQLSNDLRGRRVSRVNLFHEPGAGGTTIAKRILWDMHDEFPCAILRRCDPRSTLDRLSKLASITSNSILLLVDGSQHTESIINDLYEFVKGHQVPVVFFQTLRELRPRKQTDRSYFLQQNLEDPAEIGRFEQIYCLHRPDRTNEIRQIAIPTSKSRCTPFFFGLTALEADFKGLKSYVAAYLKELSRIQKTIIRFIAFAQYFGQSGLCAQYFAKLAGIPSSRTVDLESLFGVTPIHKTLMIQEAGNVWRTIHYLVAEEVLIQTSALEGNIDVDWRQTLSDLSISFLTLIRDSEHHPSENALELIRRVFLYRGNAELLGSENSETSRFSFLIEQIPNPNGRQAVLDAMVELFPDQPHFHAHLARFQASRERYLEAITSIKHAIDISPKDPNLHHVLGMVYRYQINYFAKTQKELQVVLDVASLSSRAFETSREINPLNEHAYIAEVQMIFAVLRFIAKAKSLTVPALICSKNNHTFVSEALDTIESHLSEVRNLRVGQKESSYETECRAIVNGFYEDYGRALQNWDNLMSTPGVSKGKIRKQIVWTLYNRAGREWSKMRTKDLVRCRESLELNLQEKPNDESSLRLWLQVIRHATSPPTLQQVIERVAYWYSNTSSLQAAYYLFVLTCLDVIEGNVESLRDSERYLEVCRNLSSYRRDRHLSLEWLGNGTGIASLIQHNQLGEWTEQFWTNSSQLRSVTGRIENVLGPQKGFIQLDCGLRAFFVPTVGGFHANSDENVRVTTHIGFMYDGLRAWEVARKL